MILLKKNILWCLVSKVDIIEIKIPSSFELINKSQHDTDKLNLETTIEVVNK